MTQKIRKAVLPVAGLGTRFLPATKSVPKEMLTILDRPILEHVVDEAREAGIEQFIFVTGRNKGMIEDHFDRAFELEHTLERRGKKAELAQLRAATPPAGCASFVRQQEPLGLGHAVWCARHLIGGEPFAVLLPDIIVESPGRRCLAQMVDAHAQTGGNLIAVEPVAPAQAHKYGIVDVGETIAGRNNAWSVSALVEKPAPGTAPSNLSILGRYILTPDILTALENQKPGAGGEIQLTDAIASFLGKAPVSALRYDGRSFDCGSRHGFILANLALALRDEALMRDIGVSMIDLIAESGMVGNVLADSRGKLGWATDHVRLDSELAVGQLQHVA
jgi:UTP--glucose-1-phosphate uridylyltransferase